MFQHDRLSNEITLFQKIKNLDYILLISVILLSVLSVFVMYSTDGGEILFHTKNHFVKLAVFFPLMIFVAFFNIKFWHNFSYIIYLIVILLLIYVSKYLNSCAFLYQCVLVFWCQEQIKIILYQLYLTIQK